MNHKKIVFNQPYITDEALGLLQEVKANQALSGNGMFTKRCHQWLEKQTGCNKALLTHSCTAALEMAAILLDIQPGDEVIMPSYTFVSTANAFVLRGAIPVFIDIREDTLNLDEHLIEDAITSKTKAIVPVHYAGVSCEMDTILAIARRYQLKVIEDAAQGIMATYKGRALGSIGDFGAYSFHETKNLISGEGGALLVNQPDVAIRSEIIWEKGTDRSRFFRGEIDKYTWQDIGSSFLPSELIAAFLWSQLNAAAMITQQRLAIWSYYDAAFTTLEEKGLLRRPIVPEGCQHNAHMYYVLLAPEINRQAVLTELKDNEIHSVFHYIPLHNSPAGQRYCRTHGELQQTNKQSESIIRLPMWIGLNNEQQDRIVETLTHAIYNNLKK